MLNIAIDGPSGSGKSTVAKLLSKKLGVPVVSTVARKKKSLENPMFSRLFSVRERIRTPDTLVRSQVLYPAELHTRITI